MAEQIMHRDLHFGCKFILLAVLALTLFAEASGLKCYQCHGFLTNEECNRDENLKDCEDEDALVYDVCESLVKYIGNQKQISKVCAKGPCTLETKNQNSALNMAEECVNNECRFCCSTDGCNTSAATPSMRVGMRTVLPSVTIAAMFVLCIQLAL